jgi:peptide/nickel transport system substrate-binding protein
MYESLVRRDQRGIYNPALAESWTVDDDARSWTFKLRSDVAFHNGDKLQGGDVVATLERVRDPGMGGELGTQGVYQSYLEGAVLEALDRHTVRIVTAEPMADLLDLLVDMPIVPQDALSGLPDKPIGSGPYRLVEAADDLVVMEAFASYWAGPPPTAELHWRSVPNAQDRAAALLAGEADLAADITPESGQAIQAAEQARVVTSPSSVCAIFMCNARSGVCVDKRVRRALNYALDVQAIIDTIMSGAARPLNGPLTPLHFGHDPVAPYEHAPELARTLLGEAGYADGLRLVLDVPTTLPDEATRVAELMATHYARVGISTDIREFSNRPAYADKVRGGQMDDAACFDSSPLSTYRVLREKFHSGVAGPWWQGYTNPAVDALIDQAQLTCDERRRRDLYQQAYRSIRDDAPWIFLYNPTLIWGVGPRGGNWLPGIDGLIRPV